MSLANVHRINGFSEVLEKAEVMEAIEVPGFHGMKTNMGASSIVVEVKIGSKCFEDVVSVIIYEEVEMSQYFEPLVMD